MNFGTLPADFFQIYELKESYAASGLITFDGDLRMAGRCTWLISFIKSQNHNEKAQIQNITNMNLKNYVVLNLDKFSNLFINQFFAEILNIES